MKVEASLMNGLVAGLEERGVATFEVPPGVAELHGRCFRAALRGLEAASTINTSDPLRISPDADSASASGVHAVGALSQYNMCREGIVFSNGDTFDLPAPEGGGAGSVPKGKGGGGDSGQARGDLQDESIAAEAHDGGVKGREEAEAASARRAEGEEEVAEEEEAFVQMMSAFQSSLLLLAHQVLAALEQRLSLEPGWFSSALGPFGEHSQWHVKRYRPDASPAQARTADGKQVLLQLHSDPSLISLVILDRPGINPGSLGLECQEVTPGHFTEVDRHGHGVVTVLVGSLLDRVTGGRFPAARHRVALTSHGVDQLQSGPGRVAATLFVRPAPTATLRKPPSPDLAGVNVPEMKFSAWRLKTQKRYEKHAPPRPAGASQAAAAGTSEGAEEA